MKEEMDARNGGRIRGRVRVEERREEGWNGGGKRRRRGRVV